MIDYGAPPAGDVVEVTLFGPGYGEAIVVHLGEGVWLLIDSCIDPNTKEVASIAYLESIGVSADCVKAVVASHWHDDHVRGISKLAAKYPEAEFFHSAVFTDREASAFLAAHNGHSSAGLARGAKELFSVIEQRDVVCPALRGSIVLQTTLNNQPALVTALSPLPAAFSQSVQHMAQYLPVIDKPIKHAPELHPNLEAVALHIDLGSDSILLGADLEEHMNFGWTAVISDRWAGSRPPATAYKVAHHGSYTGDCPALWSKLLRKDPVSILTPFTWGRHKLPTNDDKRRIRENTSAAFITSNTSRRPEMDTYQLKRLGDVCNNLTRADAGFGAVRLRKTRGTSSWEAELLGTAAAI